MKAPSFVTLLHRTPFLLSWWNLKALVLGQIIKGKTVHMAEIEQNTVVFFYDNKFLAAVKQGLYKFSITTLIFIEQHISELQQQYIPI